MTWQQHIDEAEGKEGYQAIELIVHVTTFGKPSAAWKLGQSIAKRVEVIAGDALDWYTVDRQPLRDEEPEPEETEGPDPDPAAEEIWKLRQELEAARARLTAVMRGDA